MFGRRCFQAVAALFAITVVIASLVAPTNAADEAVAASGPPLNIALFVNSSPILCYSSGHIQATKTLANLAATRINTLGGVRGRPIELTIYDNKNDLERAKQNVTKALALTDLLAMIGLSNEDRAAKIFQAMEGITGANQVPFISNVSVGDTFKKYKNVFSTRPNQELERVPVMAEFFKANNIDKVTFLGRSGVLYIDTIGRGLKQILQDQMIADHRIDLDKDKQLDRQQLDAAIAEMKNNPPGMLALAVGTAHTKYVLQQLQQANLELPVFMVGYLSKDLFDRRKPYAQPVYGIDWASVPEVESDRLFNVLGQGTPEDWIFADRRTASVENWKKNQCDAFWGNYVPSTYSTRNIAAAKEGARFADMVKLIATSAAKSGETLDTGTTYSGKTTPIEKYRKAIMADLGKTYAAGSGAFKGIFENWSFHNERVRALTPFVVILPHTIGRKQLAPTQFVRLRNGKFKPIETLYMDIDMIRAYSVDNNAKSFFAEFYLAMRVSPNFSIEDITFTNAFLDPRASRDALTNGREISIDVLHKGGKSDAYPPDMRMYKVAGRFRFTPDFSQYPFDTQQFSIDLQPKSGDKTFIIQAPPAKMRDTVIASEGWIPDKQYVSFVEDFVPMVDAFTHTPSIVPFYNVRYVWQMKRETTDYYIRVVVPLMFILIVAYLSIFIPKTHLEAIVTIQVTALLSAVALYLSLPQIDTDTATISDRIFMFDYMMVSLMIVVSILRINARVVANPWINNLLAFVHIVIVPAVLLGLVLYISKSDLLTGFMELPGWKLLGLA
ncbi:MAG: ABC transporter substrate-binding protein [Hyphomicrobiaceae bacterium]